MASSVKFTKKGILFYMSKIAAFFKRRAFILFFLILTAAIFLDFLIYVKYVYLAENKIPQVSIRAIKLPQEKFKEVLKNINDREKNLKNILSEPPVRDIFK